MTSRGYSGDVDELTPRMREVAACSAAGRTTRETAVELHIATTTVKTIRAATIARLDVRTWTEAIAVLARRGEL